MAKLQPHSGPWKAALQAGATRYYGRPCPQHPDLKGERFVQNCSCIGCIGAKEKKIRRQVAAKIAFDQRSERDRITDRIEAEVVAARRESMRELRREMLRRARLREEFAPLPRRG
jgi:hypothetical protein